MSISGRRNFFRQSVEYLFDRFRGSDSMPLKAVELDLDWIVVASVSELKPGVVKRVRAGGSEVVLRSLYEGICAEGSLGSCLALRQASGGVLQVNLNQGWPKGRLLSHLTGEPMDSEISTKWEKNDE